MRKPRMVVPSGPGRCRRCARWELTKNICIPGYGPRNPTLVVIAESPAVTEDIWCRVCQRPAMQSCTRLGHTIGQPLVGSSGQLLRRILRDAGFDPETVYYTNVVRCSSGNPTMAQIRKCLPYLWEELATLDYRQCVAIFALGELALKGITDDGRAQIKYARLRRVEEVAAKPLLEALQGPGRGEINPDKVEIATPPIRATYHPAAALPHRDPEKYEEIVSDLINATVVREPINPIAINPMNVPEDSVVGLDLEWTTTGKIRLGALATRNQNTVISSIEEILSWLARSTKN